ncbi:MAG: phosphoenolpyruvate carboxykinase (ATP) [Thermomicrobiales bacterium]|nr:phosphoenolpyruvate carboxykinase (ATP) [Thermomicrobiales bacterium]MCO5228359.1 phosphoenolpyruvate carboxykinase (ATP) [Thermomicrobiales bacterium]
MSTVFTAPVVFANLTNDELVEKAVERGEGEVASTGALAVRTGKFTGRSPKDKFVVREANSEDKIWWGAVNQPVEEDKYEVFKADVINYLNNKDILFTQELSIGADPEYAYPVNLTTESSYAALFCRHLFITNERDLDSKPITILHAPGYKADPKRHGSKTETAVMLHPTQQEIVIAGTLYSGEMKKGVFTMMQYLLPNRGVATMHCSANYGAAEAETTIFFGLSGTGKTTLSNDPAATLIGDDEHGWSGNGVFNFEGGCYAKTIHLSKTAEPTIWEATNMKNTVLENVPLDPETKVPDYDDNSLTENTRSAFSVEQVPNVDNDGMGGHAKRIVFLTADANGVLPPVSKLTREQALSMYLLGFTSKVAGTERGVTEPQRTFSPCFGSPFLPLHPERYAELLGDKIDEHEPSLWLVNTGWGGGDYATGKRISIKDTRAIITAITTDGLDDVPTEIHPVFNLAIPTEAPGVKAGVLNPRDTWADKEAYDVAANKLMDAFRDRAVEMSINPEWTGWLKK